MFQSAIALLLLLSVHAHALDIHCTGRVGHTRGELHLSCSPNADHCSITGTGMQPGQPALTFENCQGTPTTPPGGRTWQLLYFAVSEDSCSHDTRGHHVQTFRVWKSIFSSGIGQVNVVSAENRKSSWPLQYLVYDCGGEQ